MSVDQEAKRETPQRSKAERREHETTQQKHRQKHINHEILDKTRLFCVFLFREAALFNQLHCSVCFFSQRPQTREIVSNVFLPTATFRSSALIIVIPQDKSQNTHQLEQQNIQKHYKTYKNNKNIQKHNKTQQKNKTFAALPLFVCSEERQGFEALQPANPHGSCRPSGPFGAFVAFFGVCLCVCAHCLVC